MIIPNKHISINRSYIGCGYFILKQMDKPRSITLLWKLVKEQLSTISFEEFSLAMVFLFTIDAIKTSNDLIYRNNI